MNTKKKLGLLGYPLGHSFSQAFFTQKWQQLGLQNDYEYCLFEYKNIEDFFANELANNKNLLGFNVTIPHKQNIINYLDGLDETAKAVGAVNTVKREGEKWVGYNTDVIGFEQSAAVQIFKEYGFRGALILGAGGAAKAVSYVLQKYGIEHLFVLRASSPTLLRSHATQKTEKTIANSILCSDIDIYIIKKYPLIINATPCGTFPDIDEKPDFPYHLLTKKDFLYDLVYNPSLTAFMYAGAVQGCGVKNGEEMLHLQAEAAWQIWREGAEIN